MKPNQVTINSMTGIFKDEVARLLNVRPFSDYETKAPLGFAYELLAESNNFEKVTIKVISTVPVITAEQLKEASSPIYATFIEIEGRFYFSDRTKNWELTCKAKDLKVVNKTAAPKA